MPKLYTLRPLILHREMHGCGGRSDAGAGSTAPGGRTHANAQGALEAVASPCAERRRPRTIGANSVVDEAFDAIRAPHKHGTRVMKGGGVPGLVREITAPVRLVTEWVTANAWIVRLLVLIPSHALPCAHSMPSTTAAVRPRFSV